MEKYTGIKFGCKKTGDRFVFDERLELLNTWAFVLAELGLTPVHPDGAYGNQSFRTDGEAMIITRSGMVPQKELAADNYVLIERFDGDSGDFFTKGKSDPSSESILHYMIYRELPSIEAIMHGHSKLLEQYAISLGIPVTTTFHPYGTVELAESAVGILKTQGPFILLKDHGFVAIGTDIDLTGRLILSHYQNLIETLLKL